MCGRFSLTASPEELSALFDIAELGAFPPRYNIAPTQPILTVGIGASGNRDAHLVRWGTNSSLGKRPRRFYSHHKCPF